MIDDSNNYKNVIFDFEALDECPFCKKDIMIPNGKIRWLEINFWYVVCPYCGLKFMNPRPTRESYRKFYKDLFWPQKIRNIGFRQSGQAWQGQTWQSVKIKWGGNEKIWDSKSGLVSELEDQRERRAKVIIPVINEYINLNKTSKVLEVGCSFGVTLNELYKKYHSQVFAIEPSEESRNQIKKFKTIKILGRYAEDLEGLSKKGEKFNAIIFSHVLENTTDPINVIKFAKKCFSKNGIIYLQTPNLLVFDQMNPYHPFIFSQSSLKFLAKKVGLSYKRISEPKDRMLTVILSR